LGGRVVKLIGDAVLFTAPDAESACRIALEMAEACERHPLLPMVHIGLAEGDVMRRGGDVYGPVVNLAARLVEHATPGQVLMTEAVAAHCGRLTRALGTQRLKGISGEHPVAALIRPDGEPTVTS
jgi:adenylate cyclase